MEELFAVRVLVHYYDKPKVDHAAVRRLLSAAAVDSLQLLFTDGTTLPLSDYITAVPSRRWEISEVVGSSGSSLVQVASVFMLAEARAAADALSANQNELETACSALERLLGCLATRRPLLPIRDIKQSARVKLGTAARRRAISRLSRSSHSTNQQLAILKAVNAILRLCDVATHCLAVVSRQSLHSKDACENAVGFSTRLLTLAASLYEVQRADAAPALSFFSSNSLRTALVSGAMHLGAIAIEHSEIEPMTWIHVANRIVMSSSTSISPRTSVLSALFGGMIKSAKRYEILERDAKAAEGAISLLSTLHVVLETDIIRDARDQLGESSRGAEAGPVIEGKQRSSASTDGASRISQAARSFLGERVVAAEEDGDEGRIAARTVYQACEEYAERAGETDGMMGLLARLFSTAGRQCRQDSTDETVVSISEGTLPLPPDESDASSDGPQPRPDAHSFTLDVFDQRSKDGLGIGATVCSSCDVGVEQAERIELHREVGALALDTLAHWVSRAQTIRRYANLDITDFSANICRSASFFTLGNSSASYDLRSAMQDFGSLVGPAIKQAMEPRSVLEKQAAWSTLVFRLVDSCPRMNPILTSIICCHVDITVQNALLKCFLKRANEFDAGLDRAGEESQCLPTESILSMLLSATTPDSALSIIEVLLDHLKSSLIDMNTTASLVTHRTSCLLLLSYATDVLLGANVTDDTVRIALATLYHCDIDGNSDPMLPSSEVEAVPLAVSSQNTTSGRENLEIVLALMEPLRGIVQRLCFQSSATTVRKGRGLEEGACEMFASSLISDALSPRTERLCYHFFWACLRVRRILQLLETLSTAKFPEPALGVEDPQKFPLLAPNICLRALKCPEQATRLVHVMRERKHPSLVLLYVSECTALLHLQKSSSCSLMDLSELFSLLVCNALDIVSESLCSNVGPSYEILREAFRVQPGYFEKRADLESVRVKRQMFEEHVAPSQESSSLQLGMSYMRSIGSGRIADLVAVAMFSATQLIDTLTSEQLSKSKHVILEVLKNVLFISEAHVQLAEVTWQFLRKFMSKAFPEPSKGDGSLHDFLVFAARVCGFWKLVKLDCASVARAHALCVFAKGVADDDSSDRNALQFCLDPSCVPEGFSLDMTEWLTASFPRLSLENLLESLLVPIDDSAVAVSSHAQSLSLLTEACLKSPLWQSGTLQGLGNILDRSENFARHMVHRSVMESVTMNDGILQVFEKVVGIGHDTLAAKILRSVFLAARSLFEEDIEIALESRVRLLNFAFRVSMSYGRVSSECEEEVMPRVLEPELFNLLFNALEITTLRLKRNSKDEDAKRTVFFLCGLVDSIHNGLYGSSRTLSNVRNDTAHHNLEKDEEAADNGKVDNERRQRSQHVSEQTSTLISESIEPSKSLLCTYTSTGNQFVEQHWYFCYSCELAGSEGVCSTCARLCHKGCELAYSKFSRFFCDCGAGSDPHHDAASHAIASSEDGEGSNPTSHEMQGQTAAPSQTRQRKPCLCLKMASKKDRSREIEKIPVRTQNSTAQQERNLLLGTELQKLVTSELEAISTVESQLRPGHCDIVRKAFERTLKADRTVNSLISTALYLTKELDRSHVSLCVPSEWKSTTDFSATLQLLQRSEDFFGFPKTAKLARSTRLFKAGSFDVTTVAAARKETFLSVGSLISYSPHERILALADKGNFVDFIDASPLLVCESGPAEKPISSRFRRCTIPHGIRNICFHPGNANLLLVVGTENVSVLCRGRDNAATTWTQVEVEVGLSEFEGYNGANAIVNASWIEDEATLLLVCTEHFVKIFDVAVDTFCPCFFGTLPVHDLAARNSRSSVPSAEPDDVKPADVGQESTITEAAVVRGTEGLSARNALFVLVATSDGNLFVSAFTRSSVLAPTFKWCCNANVFQNGNQSLPIIVGIRFHVHASIMTVAFSEGSVFCLSFSVGMKNDEIDATIRWARVFKEALMVGSSSNIVHVRGTEASFMFFQRGQTLTAGGILTIHSDQTMEVHSFSGSASAAVLGLSSFAPSPFVGEPSTGGGFLILDDGSLHRVDVCQEPPRAQVPELGTSTMISEHRRLRSLRLSQGHHGTHNYNSIPDSIGFFEKCRPVSEQVVIEGMDSERNASLSYERMAVMLAGGAGDCVISQSENQPFRFSAKVDNQSLVLVGARMRFGGTERSRNRVPADVRVFGRTVRWQSRNGMKRWLDIPFSVPESTASPQRASFDLYPSKTHEEGRSVGDGLVALDALELYAVSTIEFTERKLLHEREKSRYIDNLKKKKNSSDGGLHKRHPSLKNLSAKAQEVPLIDGRFTEDQAVLLSIMNAIHKETFRKSELGGQLLFEINNLWSGTFYDNRSDELLFLEQLLRPCLRLCSESYDMDSNGQVAPHERASVELFSAGTKATVSQQLEARLLSGIAPHFLYIEKSLFAVAGLARALLFSGSAVSIIPWEVWCKKYDEIMPADGSVVYMLQSHLSQGRTGRSLYKSSCSATMNAVDIIIAWSIRHQTLDSKDASNPRSSLVYGTLAEMMCSLDQGLRLCTGQRLIEVLDAIDGASDFIGSPFESIIALEYLKEYQADLNVSNLQDASGFGEDRISEDSDGTQRWAYRCDRCEEVCDREWWHCKDCEDFDLCSKCVRGPTSSVSGTHLPTHILLRGTAEAGVNEQSIADGREQRISELCLAAQKVLGPIVDVVLSRIESEESINGHWRYLDAAETVSQLLSQSSPSELRGQRLSALFQSQFPSALKQYAETMSTEYAASIDESNPVLTVPRGSDVFFLMLKILLSAPSSSMPSFIHLHGIPAVLFQTLEAMHSKLRSVVQNLAAGKSSDNFATPVGELMSRSVWNKSYPGVPYFILSGEKGSKHMDTSLSLFGCAEGLNSATNVFLSLMKQVLAVLDYSFRTAASVPISEQMAGLPRSVLCDIINFCDTAALQSQIPSMFKQVSSAATRLLSTLSLDDTKALNGVLDQYLYKEQGKRLQDVNESLRRGRAVVDYETEIEVASIMKNLHRAASRHPETWRNYAMENMSVLQNVYEAAKSSNDDLRAYGLQLVAAGIAVSAEYSARVMKGIAIVEIDNEELSAPSDNDSKSLAPKSDSATPVLESSLSCEQLLRTARESSHQVLPFLSRNGFDIIKYLIREVMLKSQSQASRRAASQVVLFGMARAATSEQEPEIVNSILSVLNIGLELMPFSGEIADGLMLCLRFFVLCCQGNLFEKLSAPSLALLTSKVTVLLKERSKLLISHPNARLYGKLSGIIDVAGYYLEADPCLTCAASMWESSERRECRIDTIRAETKYTDCSIMHRLISMYEVNNFSVRVIDPRRARRVKKIDILYSTRTVSDAAELKSADHPWKKLKTLELGLTTTEANVNLVIPVASANLKLHFLEFHNITDVSTSVQDEIPDTGEGSPESSATGRRSNGSRGNDSLQCPRCSRSVTDRHGICRNCHENAYQCRQCRNINYENLDGFLCNECGYCKHGRFEFSVTGRPTYIAEPILNEEDRKRASKVIEKETGNVHRCMEQLMRFRSSIIRSLITGTPAEEALEKTKVVTSGRVGLADLLDSVGPRSEIAVLEALLEGQTSQEVEEVANSAQGGVSIAEELVADGNGSVDTTEKDQHHRSGSHITSPTHRPNRGSQSKLFQSEANVISRNTSALAVMYGKECRTLFATMSRGIRVLTLTRAELVRYANSIGGRRLQYINDAPGSQDTSFLENESSLGTADGPTANVELINSTSACCYGCTQAFIAKSVRLVQTIMKDEVPAVSIIRNSDLSKDMMLICSLCEKPEVRLGIQNLIASLVNNNAHATELVCAELSKKICFCVDSFETVDAHSVARFEMGILESTASLNDNCWEERLRLVVRILFKASKHALTCSAVAESIILPCLRVALRMLRAEPNECVTEGGTVSECLGKVTDACGSHDGTNSAISQQQDEGMRIDHENVVGVDESFDPDMIDTSSTMPARSHSESNDHVSDPGPREISSPTPQVCDRRLVQGGSDLMSGSGATSSIETARDAHISDDEVFELPIEISAVRATLERDHDAKMTYVNVGRWLDGRDSHAVWVTHIGERSRDFESREKLMKDLPSANALLRAAFRSWRRIGQEQARQEHSEDPDESSGQQPFNKLLIENDNWLVRLMLFTPCTAVRKEACALLELLCGHEETLHFHLLDVLTGPALCLGSDVGDKSKEFFDLLETTISPKSYRLYLIAKNFLPKLAGLICSRAERLILSEVGAESSSRLVNFLEGYALKRLVSVMRNTLEVIPSQRLLLRQRIFEAENCRVVKALQRAYVCVRKLISMRTRITDECASHICEALLSKELLFMGPTVTAVVKACVSELSDANERNDAQAVAILLEELCLMLCPERKEPTCLLALNKTPTQEEFIRGSMCRNPYPSSSFDGPLMRDVKDKICKDLDLPALLEDDFGMELLVAGNVVKLDLPIMAVYEHVWRGSPAAVMASSIQPSQISRAIGLRSNSHGNTSRGNGGSSRSGGVRGTILSFRRLHSDRDSFDEDVRNENRSDPPMVVVFRLSGLDGEATEPIVDDLPSDTNSEQDAEEQYSDTTILGDVGGLDILLELLRVVGSWGDDAETAVRAPALRLLRASCEVSQNRALLAKSPNAVGTLLDCAASAFEHAQGMPAAVASAESLLIAAERILAQQRKELESRVASGSKDTVHISFHDSDEVMSHVRVFLGRLALATSPNAENSILHLLPFLIQGIPRAIDLVLHHMRFSWDLFDVNEDEQRKARQLGTVLLTTPKDLRGNEFVMRTIRAGFGAMAITYIVQRFPVPRLEHKALWEDGLEGQGPPLVLKLLTGLSIFLDSDGDDMGASELFRGIVKSEPDLIPALCQLERAVSGNAIGTSAEELLEALSRNISIEEDIVQEREAIKKARREAARASRAAILKEAGLPSFGKLDMQTENKIPEQKADETDSVGDSLMKMLEGVPDEVGPACVVCGDGFQCRPEEALAFYVYCRKVSLDLSSASGGLGSRPESDSNGNRDNGGRVDWALWSTGRSRSGGAGGRLGSNSCFTTVTHLNAIHLSCHKEAARADRSSRRDEWDGASLRNSQTKCNNLLPARPPVTLKKDVDDSTAGVMKCAKSSYGAAVEGYFSRFSSLGRTSVSQSKSIGYDVGRSLLRFADGGTGVFSDHAKGGGPHSNACLIPHLVQLGIYLLEVAESGEKTDPFAENSTVQTQEEALVKYLEEDEVGDLTYYLASSLMLHNLEGWCQARSGFLKRGVNDGILEREMLFRLIAVTDTVNKIMKRGLVAEDDEHWLDSLRRHIGIDETFSQRFGDELTWRWEKYIRVISDGPGLVQALRQNVELVDGLSEKEDETVRDVERYVKELADK